MDKSAAGIEIEVVRVQTGALDKSAAEPGKASRWTQGSAARKWIAVALLVALAGLTVKTIDPGKVRLVVLVLLGIFGLRIALTASASR